MALGEAQARIAQIQNKMQAVKQFSQSSVDQGFGQMFTGQMNDYRADTLNFTYRPASSASTQRTSSSSYVYGASANNSQTDYESYIQEAAQTYGVDPKLIRSVISAESSFRPGAVSKCGAQGLMQLMPGTAKELGVTDAFDPKQNIMGGTKYLKKLLDLFDGDACLAVSAYNCGPGRVAGYDITPNTNDRSAYQALPNLAYVRKVLGADAV